MSHFKTLICLSIITLAGVMPASSAVLNQYTTEAAFIAAAGTTSVITFSEPGLQVGTNAYNSADGLWLNGLNFIGIGRNEGFPKIYDLQIVDNGPGWTWDGWYLRGPQKFASESRIVVNLPAGIRFVGSDVMAAGGGYPMAGDVAVVLYAQSGSYTVTTLATFAEAAFIGFRSDVDVRSIEFYVPAGANLVLDNFRFGAGPAAEPPPPPPGPSGEVPDPATIFLAGSGILLIWLGRRRANQAAF